MTSICTDGEAVRPFYRGSIVILLLSWFACHQPKRAKDLGRREYVPHVAACKPTELLFFLTPPVVTLLDLTPPTATLLDLTLLTTKEPFLFLSLY
jgi:hypothetical protein